MAEFGPYEVILRVAAGSTATVYKARHREIERVAAIKVLNPELRRAADFVGRFRSEAHILAGFDDPNIVTIYDFVEEPDRTWIAEEWIDGATIDALLRRSGAMTAEQSLGVLRGALTGLAYAHDRSVVHGDLSPANIIADQAGTSKLIDFGVSAPVGAGGLRGTPVYMSPEAARGEPVGRPGDVYSAASVLYHLLTGQVPFPAATVDEVLRAQREQQPPQLGGHGPAMARLLQDSLAKDASARPQDARAFLQRMEAAAEERYGATWLERASIAGLVAAVSAGSGLAAATLGGSALAAGPAAPLGTSYVGASAATGRRLSRTRVLVGVGITGALVAGAVIAVAESGSGHPAPKSSSPVAIAVDPPVPTISSATSPSAPPSPVVATGLTLHGVYKLRIRVISTNFELEKVGQKVHATWTLHLTCGGTSCIGPVTSSSGSKLHATFDGTTLTAADSPTWSGPCVYASGPKKNKPVAHTKAVFHSRFAFSLSVVQRAAGPVPAAGTALLLRGNSHGYQSRAKITQGKCNNTSHVDRDVTVATLTYVSG
jgi:serine/threonine-protein kinase